MFDMKHNNFLFTSKLILWKDFLMISKASSFGARFGIYASSVKKGFFNILYMSDDFKILNI